MSKEVQDANSPAYESAAYREMKPYWELPDDLLGRSQKMREKRERWLPKFPLETADVYNARLKRSVLFPGYSSALGDIVSKPFSKPVTIDGDSDRLPPNLQDMVDDPGRDGRTLTDFAREVFRWGWHRGVTFILVDAPAETDAAGDDLATERRLRLGPYLTHVTADNLLGVRWTVSEDGSQILSQARIKSTTMVPNGLYGEEAQEEVRVYELGEGGTVTFQLFVKGKKDKEFVAQGDPRPMEGIGQIPIVPFYTNKTGDFQGLPALGDLADLNLEHWQSHSDQKNILHAARVPILFLRQMGLDNGNATVQISSNNVLASDTEKSEVKYVEIQGASIEAGERDLRSIEERMQVMGMKPFMAKSGSETATGKKVDEGRTNTRVHEAIQGLEHALRRAVEIGADWAREEVPEDFGINIFSDFVALSGVGSDMDPLTKGLESGILTGETYLEECKRRGIAAETVDPEREVEVARQRQAEAMGEIDERFGQREPEE